MSTSDSLPQGSSPQRNTSNSQASSRRTNCKASHETACKKCKFIPAYTFPNEEKELSRQPDDGKAAAAWLTTPNTLMHFASRLQQVVDLERSGLEHAEVLLVRYSLDSALLRCEGLHYFFSYCLCYTGGRWPYLWRITAPDGLGEVLEVLERTQSFSIRKLESLGVKAEMVSFWNAMGEVVDHEISDEVFKEHFDVHSDPESEGEGDREFEEEEEETEEEEEEEPVEENVTDGGVDWDYSGDDE